MTRAERLARIDRLLALHARPELAEVRWLLAEAQPARGLFIPAVEEFNHLSDQLAEAQQEIEALKAERDRLKEPLMDSLNETTRRVDGERRRWYAALNSVGVQDLEGLAPEIVANRVKAQAESQLTALREALRQLINRWRLRADDYHSSCGTVLVGEIEECANELEAALSASGQGSVAR